MLGDSGAGAFARVWQRTGLAGVAVCLVTGMAAPPALGAGRQPDPEVLWRAYPLEQKPTTIAKPPHPATGSRRATAPARPSDAGDAPSSGPSWALLAAIAGAAALLVAAAALLVLAVIARTRRKRRPAPAPTSPKATPHAEPVARGTPQQAPPAARVAATHAAPGAAAPLKRAAKPGRVTTPPAAAGASRRAGAARRSPVCQVRWNRRGAFFYAVMANADGVEHVIARSPRIDWGGFAPPDETPEARAALRQLAKQVRERGWRPLRAKGMDLHERRWYARRFRWPTAEERGADREDAGGQPAASDMDPHVAGRSGGTR